MIIAFDPDAMDDYFAMAGELRAAGVAAEVYLGQAGMKAQMRYADRRLSPAAVIVGGDERAAGAVTIKDLDLGRALAAGRRRQQDLARGPPRPGDRAPRRAGRRRPPHRRAHAR